MKSKYVKLETHLTFGSYRRKFRCVLVVRVCAFIKTNGLQTLPATTRFIQDRMPRLIYIRNLILMKTTSVSLIGSIFLQHAYIPPDSRNESCSTLIHKAAQNTFYLTVEQTHIQTLVSSFR